MAYFIVFRNNEEIGTFRGYFTDSTESFINSSEKNEFSELLINDVLIDQETSNKYRILKIEDKKDYLKIQVVRLSKLICPYCNKQMEIRFILSAQPLSLVLNKTLFFIDKKAIYLSSYSNISGTYTEANICKECEKIIIDCKSSKCNLSSI